MAVILLLVTNNAQAIEFPILQQCTIGRSDLCDLVIDDKQMSGKHGMFDFNERGQLLYTDLGSTNGSFLNNSQIQKCLFKVNETILVGNTTITIDENRLSVRERMSIGASRPNGDEKALLIPAHKGTKSVVLNKDLKKNARKTNWIASKKESLIDQEESSGQTKFLKLDTKKPKKKA